MSRSTRGQITAARINLEGIISLVEDVRKFEGNREANACAGYPMTAMSAANAIVTLTTAKEKLPDYVTRNWKHCKLLRWHNLPDDFLTYYKPKESSK